MSINSKRLKSLFKEINSITDTTFGAGITRLAYTNHDKILKELMIKHLSDTNLKVEVDEIGNIFARRYGRESGLKAVALGSHLDSVINGGEYDGVVGVLAALEVINSLDDDGIITKRPLELVIFACEESTRFNISMLGSKAMTHRLDRQKLEVLKDFRGENLSDILQKYGLNLANLDKIKNRALDYDSFFELHVEQGPLLHSQNLQIGVVSAIAAPHRFGIKIIGQTGHSGTTAIQYRSDALCAASEVILAVERVAKKYANKSVMATCGNCVVKPGVINVIPGEAMILVDLRSTDLESRNLAFNEIKNEIENIQKSRNFSYKIKQISTENQSVLDKNLIELISQEARNLGLKHVIMPSGAGHDTMNISEFCKTAMIFVPSRNGISHNPSEFTSFDDIINGTKLLRNVVLKSANSSKGDFYEKSTFIK